MEVTQKIRELIEKEINENGYDLDEVLYENENGVNYLRVVIDKKNGFITIDDCVKVNDLINPIIDSNDPIEESYMLEVWSKERGED